MKLIATTFFYYSTNTILQNCLLQSIFKISKKYRGLHLLLRIMYFGLRRYSRSVFEISETSDFHDLRKYTCNNSTF